MQESAMNSTGVTVSDSPTPANLFDEFEEAFQNCLAPLTKEDPLNGINQEELKVNAETNGQRFLELAHRMEAFFLQKRFLLSVQKPESLLSEENHEMRAEIQRKDELIKKQTEKLAEWQNTLMNLIARVGSVPSYGSRTSSMASSGPTPPAHNHMMPGGGGQQPGGQGAVPQINHTTTSSMGMVGGMSHAPSSIHHNISTSVTMSTMMGQVGTSTMAGMSQGAYQPMNTVNSTGNVMHTVSMSSGGPSSMGHMGSTQVVPGSLTSNMGSSMTVGAPQGTVSSVSTTSGMYHGNTGSGPSSMGNMAPHQGGLQGPLAYLEKTTTNIGLPEQRR